MPVPSAPKELSNSLPEDDSAVAKFNQSMRSSWLKSINLRCQHCNKTFKASVYQKHIKTCLAKRSQPEKKNEQIEENESIRDEEIQRKTVRRCKTFDPRKVSNNEDNSSSLKAKQAKTPVNKVPKQNKVEEESKAKYNASVLEKKEKPEKPNKATKTPQLARNSAPVRELNQSKSMKPSREVEKSEREKNKQRTPRRDPVGRSSTFSVAERRLDTLTKLKSPGREATASVCKDNVEKPSTSINHTKALPAIRTKPKTELRNKTEEQSSNDVSLTQSAPNKELKLQKSVSWKERTSHDELSTLKKRINEVPHSKSMNIRKQQKGKQDVEKASNCSTPTSSKVTQLEQSPFFKVASERKNASTTDRRVPLTERAMCTGRGHRLQESLSLDATPLTKRSSDPDDQLPEKLKSSTPRAPVAYHCYLCGRQFGSASLIIHVRQCRRLWEDRESLKPKKQDRRVPPAIPKELDEPLPSDPEAIASFNQTMIAIWESQSLISCPNCARTFTCEAFEKHQRLCTLQTPGGPHGLSKHRRMASTDTALNSGPCSDRTKEDTSSEISSGPIQYYCYLCGRQYGNRSLLIHIPRCQKLWEERESLKPRKQDRKPLPDLPPFIKDFPNITLPTDPAEVKEFNDTMYEYWDRFSLYVCQICGRSFKEESFEKHQKVCTPENPGGALGVSKQRLVALQESLSTDSKKEHKQEKKSQPKFLVCYLCGRQYGTESLMIHLKNCEKQWLADEAHKPKELQRSLPAPPERIITGDLPKTMDEIAEFNEQMTAYWEEHSLIKCKMCNRKFNAEAYETHLRYCSQQTRRTYRRTISNMI
eukprot:g2307.t1